MLDGKISPEDYKEAKVSYEPLIAKLERQHLSTNTMAVNIDETYSF